MAQIALITGATAGIGEATAHLLCQDGFDVIINGRRIEELERVKGEIGKGGKGRIHLLPFDVRDRKAVQSAIDGLPSDWKQIDVLVNNAGLGLGLGPINEGIPEDWDTMIDTNIKGVLNVSHAVMPLMIAREQGHIVNLGSIAGKGVYPGGNVYSVTKHAIDALTQAMRIDLLPHHIRVTSINPGMTLSDFNIVRFKGDKAKADARYAGFTPLNAVDIADAILYAVTRPAHVTINDLTIMPTDQADVNNLLRSDSKK